MKINAGDGIWTREIQGIMGLAVPRRTRLGHPGMKNVGIQEIVFATI